MSDTVSDKSWFASDAVQSLLVTSGVRDLDSAFRLGGPVDAQHQARASRHQFKCVVQLELPGRSGPTRIYIKRQWRRVRWLPRLTDLRHRIGIQCASLHEWRGLQILKDAGFDVAEPLALFWRGWGFSCGAIVTRAVPPQNSLADMLLNGAFQQLSGERRDALIEAAVGIIARLHRARLSWRSMKAKHFYPEELPDGTWRIWLIDCEGVYRHASQRDCRREWRTFLKFITAVAPDQSDTFLSAYPARMSAAVYDVA
jgi:hypothetical protein